MDLIQAKLTSRGEEVYIGNYSHKNRLFWYLRSLTFLSSQQSLLSDLQTHFMYFKNHLDDNRIRSNGILYFSQAIWPNLVSLDLRINCILSRRK